MAYTLDTIPGNLRTAALSLEAFQFNEQSGTYKSLVAPSRALTVTGGASVPLVRSYPGRRRFCPQFQTSSSQFLRTAIDDSWNALSANENYLACAFWYKEIAASSANALGITLGTGAYQWHVILSGSIAAVLWTSGDTGPSIDSGVVPTVGAWHFVCAQFYYNGASGGSEAVSLKLRINTTDYASITGSTTIVPNASGTQFDVGAYNSGVSEKCAIDQLVLWKGTTWLNTASLDALYNNGMGINFPPGIQSGRMRERDRGFAFAY